MKPKKISFGTHVGTSLILLIFMVLCLISFATLSLVNANADWRLTQKLYDRQLSINSASTEANAQIAVACAKLMALRDESISEKDFEEKAEKLELDNRYPVSDTQSLHVTLVPDYDAPGAYRITEYRIVTEVFQELDETLPLYTGD